MTRFFDLPLRRQLQIAFGLVLLLLIGQSALAYRTTVANQEAADAVEHSSLVIDLAEQALIDLLNMETGYRGFLLTGDERFLEPYADGLESYPARLDELKARTADNPAQVARWRDIEQRAAAWQREVIGPGLALRRAVTARTASLDDVVAYVGTNEGKRRFDGIRAVFDEAVAAEQALLVERSRTAAAASRWLQQVLVGGTIATVALGLALASLLAGSIVRGVGQLASTAQQIARGDLGRRIELKRRDEIGLTAAAFDHMADQLEGTIRQNESMLDELRRSARALAQHQAELERSNRELQDFASVASHDLQEPLRKVQAFGDRLRTKHGDGLTAEGRDYLARMQNAAERMQVLINDLLAFSRVTTRAQPFSPVDLGEVARQVVSDLEVRIEQSGGRVELGPLPTIQADPLQMRQLLQNLVANGLKFRRPEEPPVVRVSGRAIENGARDGAADTRAWCELIVEDNGIGFDEKYLDRLFTIFQRLHGRNAYEGTGVGLAVCRKIVERHGGTITAHSAPGHGAKFVATLPTTHPETDGAP